MNFELAGMNLRRKIQDKTVEMLTEWEENRQAAEEDDEEEDKE